VVADAPSLTSLTAVDPAGIPAAKCLVYESS